MPSIKLANCLKYLSVAYIPPNLFEVQRQILLPVCCKSLTTLLYFCAVIFNEALLGIELVLSARINTGSTK